MTDVNGQSEKARKWPWGTQTGEFISLPKLPPEWETITDNPKINCVANLAHLALAISIYSQINSLSYKHRYQIGKMFEEECLNAKGFFSQSAQNMKGDISSERVDFVKKSAAWIDNTDRWLNANWSGPIDLDTWKDLIRHLYSLIDIYNVLWAISIEHFKIVEISVKDKLQQILKEYHKKPEQKATLSKCRRVMPILCAISAAVIFLAALLTVFHYLGWLEPIKAFIYRIVSSN